MVRTTTVRADAERVRGVLEDLRSWPEWSPWEDLDPAMERVYAGAERGVGACYAWAGDRRAGEGSMQVTAATPERVELVRHVVRPAETTQEMGFELVALADATVVTWRLRGRTTGLRGLLARVVPAEAALGRDIERGLQRLRDVLET